MAAAEAAEPGSIPTLPPREAGGSRAIVHESVDSATDSTRQATIPLQQLLRVGFVDTLRQTLARCLQRWAPLEGADAEDALADAGAALLRAELRPLVFEQVREAVDEEVRALLQQHRVRGKRGMSAMLEKGVN